MNVTAGSTAEIDRYVAMLPAEHAAFLRKLCDQHSARQAHALRNTQTRSEALEAKIRQAIEHYAVKKLNDLDHCERTGYLMDRFEAGKWQQFGLKQIPDRETVKREVDKYYADFKQ